MRNKQHSNLHKRRRFDAKQIAEPIHQPWKKVYKLIKRGKSL